MDYKELTKNLQELIQCAEENRTSTRMYIIATTKDNAASVPDYPLHSVPTSCLSRQGLDELVQNFRHYCDYLEVYEVYTDIEKFLKNYCNRKLRGEPAIIFETSARGTSRDKDAFIPALCGIFQLPHLGAEATAGVLCSGKHQ